MSRDLRDTIELAEREGLTFIDAEPGGKHMRVRFRRPCGEVLVMHINGGAKKMSQSTVTRLNHRAVFRRFARGVYHGLIVEGAQHV